MQVRYKRCFSFLSANYCRKVSKNTAEWREVFDIPEEFSKVLKLRESGYLTEMGNKGNIYICARLAQINVFRDSHILTRPGSFVVWQEYTHTIERLLQKLIHLF